jgi:hypothetical protein
VWERWRNAVLVRVSKDATRKKRRFYMKGRGKRRRENENFQIKISGYKNRKAVEAAIVI